MEGIAGWLISLLLAATPISLAAHRNLNERIFGHARRLESNLVEAFADLQSGTGLLGIHVDRVEAEVVGLVRRLDDDSYDVRQAANNRLEEISRDKPHAAALAAYFAYLISDARTSAEVRAQLEVLLLNETALPPLRRSRAEIDALLGQLDSDSFDVRAAASDTLQRLGEQRSTRSELLAAIKQRLADPRLPQSLRLEIRPLWRRVHGAWLLDSDAESGPPPSQKTVRIWLDALAGDPPAGRESQWLPHQVAQRELLDLLARADTCARTKALLKQRISDPKLRPAAAQRLDAVLDYTRPVIAFEWWKDGRPFMARYIYLPEPETGTTARGMDHADDLFLHCETDEIFEPGNYPLGEALSEDQEDGFIYAVNLPTAKRRLAYEYLVASRNDVQRLRDITAATMRVHTDGASGLTEYAPLDLLDTGVISQMAGEYLAATNDAEGDSDADGLNARLFGKPSRHAEFCLWLGRHGTGEAIPCLVNAIETGRIYKPDKDCRFHLPWIAALMIAQRNATPATDAWLATQIMGTDPLDLKNTADVGATAAALLLRRRHEIPADFGLDEVRIDALSQLHLQGYRFDSAVHREAVLRWWSKQPAPVIQ